MRQIRAIALGAAALVIGQGTAYAQPAFSRRDLQVANHFGSFLGAEGRVTTGDFNGDGKPDLIVSSLKGLSVLLNTGGGQFGPAQFYPYLSCGSLTPADFNGDGKLDLYADEPCDFNGRIMLGRGDGTFSAPQAVEDCNKGSAGDFNGDGKPDLACNSARTSSLRVLLGNGDGSFRPGITIQPGPSQVLVADFNHDGKMDIADKWGDQVSVFPGRGDGTFGAPVQTAVSSFAELVMTDFNGDGLPDLATGSDIFLGKGDGSFLAPRHYFSGDLQSTYAFGAADFDGDGRADLVAGSSYVYPVDDRVRIFLGKGDGSMAAPLEYTAGMGDYYGAISDLDGDGRPDLVTANLSANTVSLLLTKNAITPPFWNAVSSASGSAVLAPGSLATLYLTPTPLTDGLVPTQAGASDWPTELGGISLELRDSLGNLRLVQLLYVSSTQINFLVPDTAALGDAVLSIARGPQGATVGTARLEAAAPGIFLASPIAMTGVAFAETVAADGSRSSYPTFACPTPDSCVPVPATPSAGGTRVSFYGTGFRNASISNVECRIDDLPAPIEFAGPSGTPGLDQITFRLPDTLDEFWDDVSVAGIVCSINGVLANRIWFLFSR
ncbi:MAG TPA: FG-GAP-like repeat-containing protein [Bryobacteraceae bacterium]|nr:FG-GAP-like repeat-containing protein [Bryobacteraceae bacterium]